VREPQDPAPVAREGKGLQLAGAARTLLCLVREEQDRLSRIS